MRCVGSLVAFFLNSGDGGLAADAVPVEIGGRSAATAVATMKFVSIAGPNSPEDSMSLEILLSVP